MIFLYFSLVWTLFTFGFLKMAWPSTLLNQLSFCLAHHRDSNLCLVSSLSMLLGQSFQFLIRSRYSVQHLIPTSQWNLTSKLSSSCFYLIRSLKQIRSSLDDSKAGSVASSLVSSHLDYVNSILYGTSSKNINRLQRIQHSLARVVTNRCSRALPSATALLKQLHWLPVEWRIRFKLATMTFKALPTIPH